MARRFTLTLSALVSAALLTACGGAEQTANDAQDASKAPEQSASAPQTPSQTASPSANPSTAPTASTAPSAVPSPSSSPRGGQAPETAAWTTSRKSGAARAADPAPVLEAVRVGRHETFQRVVFEFSQGTPEFYAQYTETLRQGGSGRKIEVEGEHILLLVFRGQTPESHFDSTPTTPVVSDVVTASIFEGDMRIGIGLETGAPDRPGFRVSTFGDKVVLDFAHTASGSPN